VLPRAIGIVVEGCEMGTTNAFGMFNRFMKTGEC
jgi:hypothetical protein